ncbi:MAG: SWIM zinc finger family protein, partial [Kiritimatiellae bacterium]|nr:SWIM zinc finger family protein [Kiritimatiellia bacterium]
MSRKRYPLRVARGAHGIRAQDLRTLARKDWWARRWIASLEAMRLGPRFGRGRQYATGGQVTELMLEGPHVEATVVGSRDAPYRLTLDFTSAAGEAQERIASAIAAEPMLLGRLLTDDLPTEIETLFRAEGIPLFPQASPLNLDNGRPAYDVKMRCSCPDWARPCKHLVAVMLLLGEEVAQRPSTLLSLRGIDAEDLAGEYGDERRDTPDSARQPATAIAPCATPAARRKPLAADHEILRRLGPIPFWRGTARCAEA